MRTGFGADREVTVVGNMLGVNIGESVELTGRWTVHADYGKQFTVEQMRAVLPATVAGMEKYLGSGLIRGVGPVTAKRIVDFFGVETLDVIEQQPERLFEVPGVGHKRAATIVQAWAEQRAIKEVMLFLQSYGVSTSLATKIYKHYGDAAIATVKNDPYRLARDIFGIGFVTADKIAQAMGLPPDAPQRVAAGVAYALDQASEEGHVYLPTAELVKLTAELLKVTPDLVGLGVARMWAEDQVKVAPTPGAEALPAMAPTPGPAADETPRLIFEQGGLYATTTVDQAQALLKEDNAIYLTPLYYSEVGVANRLLRLTQEGFTRLAVFQRYTGDDWQRALHALEQANGFALAPQQREAVQTAITRRVTVLTGGPGTGKTTTVRTILQLCQQARTTVLLAAPTGRAAKRLSETTGHEAKTIHRLLEFKPSEGMTFQRNDENPLEGDLLIVDEASMLDAVLTNSLLKAIPPGMHLLLVGDVDQLPSVGPGNVLRDIIAAIEGESAPGQRRGRALADHLPPGGRLYIIANAHRINQGEMPIIDNERRDRFLHFQDRRTGARSAVLCGAGDGAHPPPLCHPAGRYPGAESHASGRGGRGRAQRGAARRRSTRRRPARRRRPSASGPIAPVTASCRCATTTTRMSTTATWATSPTWTWRCTG